MGLTKSFFYLASFLVLLVSVLLPLLDRSSTFQVNTGGIVVISGCTSGLGKDAAMYFAKQGYYVLAGARTESKAQKLQESVNSVLDAEGSKNFHAFVLDVADELHHKNAEKEVRKIIKETGLPFTGLINNAGVHFRQLTDDEVPSVEIWRKLYEVNVFAPVSLVQVFDELLKEHKGRVVNVGSVAGEICIPGSGLYCSSKFALKALSDSMRVAYKPFGVSVSLVSPGYVRSNMCDPKVRNDCGRLGPEDTTTPAYFDAMTSTNPQSKYLVAHIGAGMHALWSQAFPFIPTRVKDMLLAKIH